MIFTTIDQNGEPVSIIQVPDIAHKLINIPTGLIAVDGEAPPNSYYSNGTWVEKPVQPSIYHTWDKATKVWVDQRTQAQKLSDLELEITTAVQDRLDSFARGRRYDGIMSACTYATSNNPQFKKEGSYCVTARDDTWATVYNIMNAVQVGTRPMPTSYADIVKDLPILTWPV